MATYYRYVTICAVLCLLFGCSKREAVEEQQESKPEAVQEQQDSKTNLSAIGKACLAYSKEDPAGKFPPNLQTLVDKGYLTAQMLESKRKPKGFAGPSYKYIAGQTLAMDPGNVIAFENPELCYQEINVLFLDMHVQAMEQREFLHEFGATCKRLGPGKMPPDAIMREVSAWVMRVLRVEEEAEKPLSEIAKACFKYASDDLAGKLPPNLQTLVDKGYLPAQMLESKRKPKGFAGPSYIYIAGHSLGSSVPADVLAFENPEFCDKNIRVVFIDGHVTAVKREKFLRELEATYKRLGREMPEIKFKAKDPG